MLFDEELEKERDFLEGFVAKRNFRRRPLSWREYLI